MEEVQLEILTEEQSMETFLRGFLPRVLPDGFVLDQNCFIRPHEGKNDLRKSIPRKIRAFRSLFKQVKVLILHDQDANDCEKLKSELIDLITQQGSAVDYLVRIVCRELENWYLGDFTAIETVYPSVKAVRYQNKRKFRAPDHVHGSEELQRICKDFSKTECARKISPHITVQHNRSRSFQHFVAGLERLLAD